MTDQISLLSHLLLVTQIGLGIVFLLSVLPKLRSPFTFTRNVAEYRLLPNGVAHGLALVLIPLEAFLAIAFLTSWLTSVALPLAAAMLILFFIAVSINLKRGQQISCGCFGDSGEQISPRTLVRLCLLLATVMLLAAFDEVTGTLFRQISEMPLDRSMLIYLMQTTFLAVFLILMTNWLLNWPELAFLVRHGYGSRLSPGTASTEDMKET